MIDIEQRLQDAYRAKAATITDATLRDERWEPVLAPVIPVRRRRTPFLAAAAVVALTGGVAAAIAFAGGTATPPARPTPAPTTSSVQPAPKPDVLPRTAVPWDEVGSGWTVVTREKSGRATVELVAPDATAYRVATLPAEESVMLWSPDHQRLLVYTPHGVQELTLRTGVLRPVSLPAGVAPISYTRPTGTAVLAVGGDSGVLRRYDVRTGTLQQTYPHETTAGPLDSQDVVYDADGGLLAIGADPGVVVLANGGQPYLTYPAPSGTTWCVPLRWNGTSSVEAACSGTAVTNVWRFPLDGTTPLQLTHGPHGTNLFGYSDIWSYDGGRLGLAPNGCGPASLVRFDAAGVGTEVSIPLPRGVTGPFDYQGHDGAVVRLMGHTAGQCTASGYVLLAYDAATDTTRVLAPTANSDGVLQPAVTVAPQDR